MAAVAILLAYEHWLVRPDDLTRVNMAFFNVNAVISIGLFVVGSLDVWTHTLRESAEFSLSGERRVSARRFFDFAWILRCAQPRPDGPLTPTALSRGEGGPCEARA